MNRLLLVRHGENKANLTKEFSHRIVDYPLTPKGMLQAEQTAQYLSRYPVNHVYSSPLKRALETAQKIAEATAAPLSVLEAFREVNVGRLEEVPPSKESWALHDSVIGGWWDGRPQARFPGGEDYAELLARVRQGYMEILSGREGQTLVVVAHGGSITLPLLSLCPDLDRAALRVAAHHNCAVSELEGGLLDGRLELKLKSWAACEHLSGEAAQLVPSSPAPDELPDER